MNEKIKCAYCIEERYNWYRGNTYKGNTETDRANALSKAIHDIDTYEAVTIYNATAVCFNHLRDFGKYNK